MATDYNAINFKNKDIDKFSTRFGNDKKDPKKKNDTADRTTAPQILPAFETENAKPTKKDWRDRSVVGAVLHGTPIPHKDKGGKKGGVVAGGGGGKPDYGNMDKSCKKP